MFLIGETEGIANLLYNIVSSQSYPHPHATVSIHGNIIAIDCSETTRDHELQKSLSKDFKL